MPVLLKNMNAHAGSRARVTSMGGLYDAATLRALEQISDANNVTAELTYMYV